MDKRDRKEKIKLRERIVGLTYALSQLSDLPQLIFRIVLGIRFYKPTIFKLTHMEFMTTWFTELGYPLPFIMAWCVGLSQLACLVLLPLGLFTRLVAFVQSVVMVVAITTVHWKNGFSDANDGIEIPLYYLLMLFSLFIIGPGRISLDYLLMRRWRASLDYPVPTNSGRLPSF
jgi:putative oxidoreductase